MPTQKNTYTHKERWVKYASTLFKRGCTAINGDFFTGAGWARRHQPRQRMLACSHLETEKK